MSSKKLDLIEIDECTGCWIQLTDVCSYAAEKRNHNWISFAKRILGSRESRFNSKQNLL